MVERRTLNPVVVGSTPTAGISLGHLSGEALRFATAVGVFDSRMVHNGGGSGDDGSDDD